MATRAVALRSRVAELLEPGSEFSRRFAARLAGDPGVRAEDHAADHPRYEDRPGQRDLAGEIAETLEWGGVRVAEAPTGIGKSLAYLLPSVLLASEQKARVVVATCTRSLQDQLFERDLPAVLEALGLELKVQRLKGKQNYACAPALASCTIEGEEEQAELDRLRGWATGDSAGDLDRYVPRDAEAFRRIRPRVQSDPQACTGASCRRGRECFWVRARRQAAEASVLVVNHALRAAAGEADGLLPEFDALIVDEAHRLESVLLSQLERSVSLHRVDELLRTLGSRRAATGGLLARLGGYALPLLEREGEESATTLRDRIEELSRRTGEARAAAEVLFARLAFAAEPGAPRGARRRYRTGREILGNDLDLLETMLEHLGAFTRGLSRAASELRMRGASPAAEELASELEQTAARFLAVSRDLEDLCDPGEKDWVHWRTERGALHAMPIHAGRHAHRLVFDRCRAVVLTSATLATGGRMEFFAERLGLGEEEGIPYEASSHPSPFALDRQMQSWVYEGGRDEAEAVCEVVAGVRACSERNILVLLTAHERLRRARERLLGTLPPGTLLFAQEWDGPAVLLAERFRAARGAILLGVQSLWEGVDFPGGALEVLVVAKLPFAVPDEPWVEARAERLRDRGRDPFRDDAVPEAVLRFRQGVGRLIRRADDRGALVVCDPRLVTASYRQRFLEALPGPPRATRDARLLAATVAEFLNDGRGSE